MNHNPVLESYLKNLLGELSAAEGDDGEVLHSYCELSNVGAGRWGRGVFRRGVTVSTVLPEVCASSRLFLNPGPATLNERMRRMNELTF